MSELDMENRDPNNLNDHVKVAFEDCIAEPDGAHSIDCVWKLAYKCFSCSKSCCYNILAIFCGICIALGWGCVFAYVAFCHVWAITPCLRCHMIECGAMQKFWGTCLQCCIAPICEAYGLLFSGVVVTNK